MFTIITLFGFYLGVFVPGVSAYVSNSYEAEQTMAFLILACSPTLYILNVRSASSVFCVKLSSNKSLFEMVVLVSLITIAIVSLSFTQELSGLVHTSLNRRMLATFLFFVPIFVNEMIRFHFSEVDEEEEVT